jgi:hypothetical protein
MTDMEIEKEIVAKGKTAARVTQNVSKALSAPNIILRPLMADLAPWQVGPMPAKRCQLLATLILSRLNY